MNAIAQFLLARLAEPSTWAAIGKFFVAAGGSIAAAGHTMIGMYVGAIGVGIAAVGEFLTKEHPSQ